MNAIPGTFRESDNSAVPMSEAKVSWAEVARNELVRVATVYGGLITYGELADEVQTRSGIRTRMLMHYWIGDVLGMVARNCYRLGEPLLSALCVHADGTIGDGYGWAIDQTYGGSRPEDLDMHAAEERFKCYRHFGSEMPLDGGRPTLTPKWRLSVDERPDVPRRSPGPLPARHATSYSD